MTIPEITVAELRELQDPYILDVRESDEHAAGVIPGSVLIPMSLLLAGGANVESIPRDRSVYVLCRSGVRSARVTEVLRDPDYGVDAYNIAGGILAWQEEGGELGNK